MKREPEFFHDGMRRLQDEFGTRRIADRLADTRLLSTFSNEEGRKLIERSRFFFLATVDADGWPECSYKGGAAGFVQIVDDRTLAFPAYDGNGMYRSLGNVLVNPRVAMLFIDFETDNRIKRLRVNGAATARTDDPLLDGYPGAHMVVRVAATHIFPNCPRYIPKMQLVEESPFVPAADQQPPIPAWKRNPELRPYLPAPDQHALNAEDERAHKPK